MTDDNGTAQRPCGFERVRALLRGESFDARVDGSRKMMGFVLGGDGSNTRITRESVELQFVGQVRRRPHSYFLSLAPGIVMDIMARLGVSEVLQPTVGVLEPSRAVLEPWLPQRGLEEEACWIVPSPEAIDIVVRPLSIEERPATGPIPRGGPWRLPEPLRWVKPEPVYVSFDGGLRCPRCESMSPTFRSLGDGVLVCGICGRSFEKRAHCPPLNQGTSPAIMPVCATSGKSR